MANPISSILSSRRYDFLSHISIIVLILFAAFCARSWVSYDHVFNKSADTKLLGVDSYFHLRHAKYIVNNYPHIQRWDHGSHYPNGVKNRAAGLFSFSIATMVILVYSQNATLNEVAAVAAWFTPILGTLSLLLLYFITCILINKKMALMTMLLFAIYPGNTLDRSILGFVDHHVMEYFLALAIALAIVVLLKHSNNDKPWWQLGFIYASPLVFLAYTWQGAAIFLPVITIAFLLYCSVVIALGENSQYLATIIMRYALALAVSFLTVNFIFPQLVIYPRGMNWLIGGSFGLALFSWCYLFVINKLTIKYNKGIVSISSLLGLLTVMVAFLQITELGQSIINAVFDPKASLIREETPVNIALYLDRLGIVGILALPSALIALLMIWKRRLPFEVIIPLTFSYTWLLIWWFSGDFGYIAPAFLSFNATITLYGCYQFLKIKKANTWIIVSAVIVTFTVLLSPLYPLNLTINPWVDQLKLSSLTIYKNSWFNALDWLQKNTPEPAKTPYSELTPISSELQNYGVMASWDFGNIIASHGNRIPIASRYPSSSVPLWALAQDEQASLKLLCPKCNNEQSIRYAIVDADTFGPFFYAKTQYVNKLVSLTKNGEYNVNGGTINRYSFGEVRDNSILAKLYAGDGSELSHYRMVYESPEQSYNTSFLQLLGDDKFNFRLLSLPIESPQSKQTYVSWDNVDVVKTSEGYLYDDFISATIKIYEVVEGEKIQGTTYPGAFVQSRLALYSKTTNRTFTYKKTVIADEKGHYTITVPYPINDYSTSPIIVKNEAYQVFIKRAVNSEYVFSHTY
jgi:dolichyl-diphosphooligosaccharide--protein glycosyltransferase